MHRYFKINEDDILHIVKQYLLSQLTLEQSQGKLEFVQTEDGEIQIVAAISEMEDDSIQLLELNSLASKIALNGPISSLDDPFQMDFNSLEAKQHLQKLIDKLENKGI